MWKFYFNCGGPVVIEAGNLGEARRLCAEYYGCDPCELLGCDPPNVCGDNSTNWRPDEEFLKKAEERKFSKGT